MALQTQSTQAREWVNQDTPLPLVTPGITTVTGAGGEKMLDSKKSLCNPTPQFPSLKT